MSCGSCKDVVMKDGESCPDCSDKVEMCPSCGSEKGEKCEDGSCSIE